MGIGKSVRIFALVLFTAALCLGLAGCATGGGAGKDGVSQDDLVGYWHIYDSGKQTTEDVEESVGMYMFYRFDSDRTFSMAAVLAGSPYERIGTYKVEGGKVLVSVPAMKETSAGAITLHADALVDAEITIENGVLTSDEISADGSTTFAERITEAEYKQMVSKSKAKATSLGI